MKLFISAVNCCITYVCLTLMTGCYSDIRDNQMCENDTINIRKSNRMSHTTYVRENVFMPISKGAVTGIGIWATVCGCLFCWPCIVAECCIQHCSKDAEEKKQGKNKRASSYVERESSNIDMHNIIIGKSKVFTPTLNNPSLNNIRPLIISDSSDFRI